MTMAIDVEALMNGQFEQLERLPADVPDGLTGPAKRALDLVLATGVALFTLPLLLVIAGLIRLGDGGPALFRQTRCGRDGQRFTIYKFRTMAIDAEDRLASVLENNPEAAREWEETQKLQNDPRITRLGKFLRKSSLDELPQLLNILRGDMSVVGPRPVTYAEIPRYGTRLPYYLAARPGITGLWQVNGRNRLTYDERMDYDQAYAKDWSFGRDLMILAKTVPAVLFSRGAF